MKRHTKCLLTLVTACLLAAGCGGDSEQTDADMGSTFDLGEGDLGSTTDTGSSGNDTGGSDLGIADMGVSDDAGTQDAGADAGDEDAGAMSDGTAYVARRDRRRCPAPQCGGWWLSEANSAQTDCADGTRAAECYVAEIDWSGASYPEADTMRAESAVGGSIFEGEISMGNVLGQDIGVLAAHGAWLAEWGAPIDTPASFAFHGLADDGSNCVAEPCFTIDVTLLNDGTVSKASAFNMEGTAAEPDDVMAAEEALRAGRLRAAGSLSTDVDAGPNGNFGETYDAVQFYVPL